MTEQPAATLLYTKEIVAFDPTALERRSLHPLPLSSMVEAEGLGVASGTTQTSIVLAQTGPAPEEGLNPLLTTSYYDLTVYDNIFDSLAERQDLNTKAMIPALATSWEVASDQQTWTVHLRQGVTWHDGVAFTADDVKFTFDSYFNDDIGSPTGAFIKEIIGSTRQRCSRRPTHGQIQSAKTLRVFRRRHTGTPSRVYNPETCPRKCTSRRLEDPLLQYSIR